MLFTNLSRLIVGAHAPKEEVEVRMALTGNALSLAKGEREILRPTK